MSDEERGLPERGSEAWCTALAADALAAAARDDGDAIVAIASELRQHGLERPTPELLSAWTQLLTPLFYVAKRKDLADKMIAALEGVAARQSESALASSMWLAQLTYARARRALIYGDQLESALLFEEVVRRFDACGDRASACLYRVTAGFSYNLVGAYDRAQRLLEEAIVIAETLANPRAAANAKSNLAVTLCKLARFDDAERLQREAINYFSESTDRYYRDAASLYLSFVFADSLRWSEALATVAPLITEDTAGDIRFCALTVQARAELAAGRAREAFAHASAALKLLTQLGTVEEGEEAARLVFAQSALAVGDERAAMATLRTARARLLSKTANASDPALREAYLGRVAENVELLALAKSLLSRG